MKTQITALFVVLLGSVLFLGPGGCPQEECIDEDEDGFCNALSTGGERPMEVDCDDSNPDGKLVCLRVLR